MSLMLWRFAVQAVALTAVAALLAQWLQRWPAMMRWPLRASLLLTVFGIPMAHVVVASAPTLPAPLASLEALPFAERVLMTDTSWSINGPWSRLAMVCWCVGSLCLVGRLAVQSWRSWRLRQSASPVCVPALPGKQAHRAVPRFRESSQLHVPATIGNDVVLPVVWRDLGAPMLAAIWFHEYGHVRRRDFWWLLVTRVHCALLWWNPLSWWTARQLEYLGERLSDRDALATGIDPVDYAELLLRFAQPPAPVALAVGLAPVGSLTRRVHELMTDAARMRRPSGNVPLHRTPLEPGVVPGALSIAGLALLAMLLPVVGREGIDRFVIVPAVNGDVFMRGEMPDVTRAVTLSQTLRQPVIWYRRGSHERIIRDPAWIRQATAIFGSDTSANPGTAAPGERHTPEQRFHTLRRLIHSAEAQAASSSVDTSSSSAR